MLGLNRDEEGQSKEGATEDNLTNHPTLKQLLIDTAELPETQDTQYDEQEVQD